MKELTTRELGDETFTEVDPKTGHLVTYCIFTGELVDTQAYSSDVATRFKYTPEIGNYIADCMREGETLTKLAEREDMPSAAVIYRWRRRYPDFATKLTEAREDRAEHYAEKAILAVESATDKDDMSVAKEQAKVYQWHAERSNPKQYGKKSEVKIEAEIKTVPMYVIDTGISRDSDVEDVEYAEVETEVTDE